MNILVVTPPLVEPVTMQQVFLHLRLDDPEAPDDHPDYPLLVSQLAAARGKAEQDTRRAFIHQTLRIVGASQQAVGWFWHWRTGSCGIELRRPPFIEVLSVTYYDAQNAAQMIDPGDYYVTDDLVPRLMFVDGFSVPCTYRRDDAVRVDYIAGYPPKPASGSAPIDYRANVPDGIKQAILIGVQLQYDDLTGDQRESLEKARDSLLASFRVHSF